MVYQWAEGRRHTGSAQEVGVALEQVRAANNGELRPRDVVNAAQFEDSPLHKHFQWDDAKAANAWRDYEARDLIASVVVVYSEIEGAPTEPMRAFSHIGGESPAYRSTLEAIQSPALRAVVLANAKKELEGWRRRYKHYQELAAAVRRVEEALTEVAAA